MISGLALKKAVEMLEAFGSDVSLVAKPNSVICNVARTNVPMHMRHSAKPIAVEGQDSSRILDDSKLTDDHGHCEHTEAMRCSVKDAAEVMVANRQLAAGTVAPLIREIYQSYNDGLEKLMGGTDPIGQVVINSYHDIWSNDFIAGLARRYKTSDSTSYKNAVAFPDQSDNVLLECMKLDSPSVNGVLGDWLEDMGIDKIRKVFNSVFRATGNAITIGSHSGARHVNTQGMDRNDNLIAFLIARNLGNHIEGETSVPYATIKNALSKAEYAAGHAVYMELEQRRLIKERKALIYDARKSSKKTFSGSIETSHVIMVNGDVLQDYVSAGGSTEAIIGAVMGKGSSMFSDIIANKAEYEKRHQAEINIRNRARANDTRTIKIIALKNALRKFNATLEDDDKFTGLGVKQADTLVDEYISRVEQFSNDDDECMIRKAVCNIYYPRTNVGLFMEIMTEVGNTSEIEDPREAAFIASLELLAKWFASQIDIKR